MIMKNETPLKEKLTLLLLAIGVCCFGLIFPDSFSDHVKLVHFSAHFGMSFLLALSFYMFCAVKTRISRPMTYTILITVTLLIGVFYKFWEITTEGMFERFGVSDAIRFTGVMTSMSQNLSGLLAAILLLEGLVVRNLSISGIRPGSYYTGPGSMQGISMRQQPPNSPLGTPSEENQLPGRPFPREASYLHDFR